MSGSLNRVDIIGNLGSDPEIRRLQSGDPVVNLRIAVTDTWRDKSSGERKERTEWIPVTIYNDQLAKVAEAYLRKGMKVFVSGSWQTRKWQDQTGNDRYTTEVVLQKFRGELQMLDSAGSNDDRAREQAERRSRSSHDDGSFADELDDPDSLPF